MVVIVFATSFKKGVSDESTDFFNEGCLYQRLPLMYYFRTCWKLRETLMKSLMNFLVNHRRKLRN